MNKKYPDEFKQEAVRQVLEKGFSIPSVAKRLGISDKSLYYWVSKAKKPTSQSAEQAEIRKLKAELKRVTEERNILKEAAEDSSHQSNRYTKLLICMRTLNETIKTYIYHRRERPCF
jgi:transposase